MTQHQNKCVCTYLSSTTLIHSIIKNWPGWLTTLTHVEHKLTLISIAGTRANEHKLKVVGSQTTKRIAVKGMDRFHVSTGFARLS